MGRNAEVFGIIWIFRYVQVIQIFVCIGGRNSALFWEEFSGILG